MSWHEDNFTCMLLIDVVGPVVDTPPARDMLTGIFHCMASGWWSSVLIGASFSMFQGSSILTFLLSILLLVFLPPYPCFHWSCMTSCCTALKIFGLLCRSCCNIERTRGRSAVPTTSYIKPNKPSVTCHSGKFNQAWACHDRHFQSAFGFERKGLEGQIPSGS